MVKLEEPSFIQKISQQKIDSLIDHIPSGPANIERVAETKDMQVNELEKNLVAVFDAHLSKVDHDKGTVTFYIKGIPISEPISVLKNGGIFGVIESEIKVGLYELEGKIILKTLGYKDEFLMNFGDPQTELEDLKQKLYLYRFLTDNKYNI